MIAQAMPTDVSIREVIDWFSLADVETWTRDIAQVRLPKSGVIDFDERPFLREILRDLHPEIVTMKGAQLGLTTVAVLRSLWMLTTFPTTGIYTMPRPQDVTRFAGARVNPIIRRSEYLRARVVAMDSVQAKQLAVAPGSHRKHLGRRLEIPRSTIYFQGAASETETVSVDADLLIHDEEDLSDPQVIEQYESRLDASIFKWRFRLSTPRLPGAGIDRVFKTTEQRHWFVSCHNCHAEFELAFPGENSPWDYGNIEPETYAEVQRGAVARYKCHRCGTTITDEDRLHGRWVVTDPKPGAAHGYTVSQMAAVWVSAERILERKARATWEQDFWNLVLGIAWQSDTLGFTKASLIEVADPERPLARNASGRFTVMGVDPGGHHDWLIDELVDGVPRTIAFGAADDWEELDHVVRLYSPTTVVVDGAFDPTACAQFAARWNTRARRRVWLAFTTTAKAPVSWDEKNGYINYQKHSMLSVIADELLAGECRLPRYDGSAAWERFASHFINSHKIPVWVKGLERDHVLDHYEWHEVGPDHQFHAKLYAWLARHVPRGSAAPTGIITLNRGRIAPRERHNPALG